MKTLHALFALGLLTTPLHADADRDATHLHRVGMDIESALPCNGPALSAPGANLMTQALANNVVRIMCIAAKSDGSVAVSEARQIMKTYKNVDFIPTLVTLSADPDLDNSAKAIAKRAVAVAIRESVSVMAAHGGFNGGEQEFLSDLVQSVNLSEADVLQILGLTD